LRIDSVISGFVKLAAAAGAALIGVAAATAKVNQQTVEQLRMAKSVGLSVASFEAWSDVMDDIGKGGESVIKMMTRFNRVIGEMKAGITTSKEYQKSIRALGGDFKKLIELEPEEQFTQMLDLALAFNDPQVADGVVAKIMGRDAPVVLGYLRQVGKTMSEILEQSKAMVFFNEEGAAGATAFAVEFDGINTAVQTLKKQFFGLIGAALAPYLSQLKDWLRANREIIQTKLREWANRLAKAIVWVTDKIKKVVDAVDDFVDRFGGWENVLKLLGIAIASLVTTSIILKIFRFIKAVQAMGTAAFIAQAKMFLIPLAIAAVGLAIEDLVGFAQGKDSAFEHLLRKAAELFNVEDVDAYVESVRDAVNLMWDMFSGFFEGLGETAAAWVMFWQKVFTGDIAGAWDQLMADMDNIWGDTWESIKEVLGFVVGDIKSVFGEMVDWVKANVTDRIVNLFWDMLKKSKDAVRKIPLIGEVLAGAEPEKLFTRESHIASIATGIAPALQRTGLSPFLRGVGAGAGAGVTNVTNETRVNIPAITVNAARGQSEEMVAKTVSKKLGQAVADSVRAANTGVEY
jgi:hypothetical protein